MTSTKVLLTCSIDIGSRSTLCLTVLFVAGKKCTVYDVIFHTKTYEMGQEVNFEDDSLYYVISIVTVCKCSASDSILFSESPV